MRRTAGTLILIISFFMAGTATAGPSEDASNAFRGGDYATAYRIYKPLGDQGNADAQNNLGVMYQNGFGVPQDYAEAVKWYRKSAEQGSAPAQFNLGGMYSFGFGVPQDKAEAVKWLRRAADQGHPSSQYNLGIKYANGEGIPQDLVLAHVCFNLASSLFPVSEKEKRELAGNNRDILSSAMTPDQIAEAQKLAREWKPKKEK